MEEKDEWSGGAAMGQAKDTLGSYPMALSEHRKQWEAAKEMARRKEQAYEAQKQQLAMLQMQAQALQGAAGMPQANVYSQLAGVSDNLLGGIGPVSGFYPGGIVTTTSGGTSTVSVTGGGYTTYDHVAGTMATTIIDDPMARQFIPQAAPIEVKPEDEEIVCGSSFGGELLDLIKGNENEN